MTRPQVDILQSPAEGTNEAAPRVSSSSVSSSRSLSISTTPAETYPEKDKVSSPSDSVNSTNLSEVSTGSGGAARIGNATCWGGTLKAIQDAVLESANAANAPRLSSEYSDGGGVSGSIDRTIGVAKVGAATCWSKLSTLAWDLTLPDVDGAQRSGETKPSSGETESAATSNAERLRRMAAESVKAPELPSSEVDEDGLAVEVIETIDSL